MSKTASAKEPFIRIRRRGATSFLYRTSVRVVAILFALLIGTFFLQGVGKIGFGEVWKCYFDGSMIDQTTKLSFWKECMLLLLISLALTPAFKMRFWNIGGQGQVMIGALATSIVMFYGGKGSMSNASMIIVSFLFSIIAGGIWAAIPAIFKVKLNVNETLFTLMMNYIAIVFVAASIDTWKGVGTALELFNKNTETGWLPGVGENPYGLIIIAVLAITVLLSVYMKHTKQGYEISVVGESLKTARYAGMNTTWIILRTVFISGALCGLCGFFYIAGIDHCLKEGVSGNYGFTAIIVSWASSFNPYGMLIITMLITFLSNGTVAVADAVGNLTNAQYITVGILLFFLIGCEFFIQYQIIYNTKLQTKFDNAKEKIHNAMPWWFAFWSKCAKSIDDAILKVHTWISVQLQKLKESLVKIFKKKDQPSEVNEKDNTEVKDENKEEVSNNG